MAGRLLIPENIYDYLFQTSVREPDVLRRLREETAPHPRATMQITPDQGQFMALLVRLLDAKRTLEIGVFTGYSSLAVALALPVGGKIIACDISDEYTQTARKYWKEAGVDHKIDLHIGPALETLKNLEGPFDFAFIDADKTSYDAYYEHVLKLLRPGGLIMIDNVLWSGRVADPDETDPDTLALKALNKKLHNDWRIHLSMLPVGDGVTLALKR